MDLKSAESSLLRTTIDAIPHGVQRIDKNFTVQVHNKVFETWVGRSYVGEKCFQALWGKDKPCDDCQAAAVLNDGEPRLKTIQAEFPSAGMRHLKVQCSPLKDSKGEITGLVELAEDITIQQSIENEFGWSEQKLQHLLGAVSDIVWELDPEGILTYVSPRGFEILGYEAAEIIGKSVFDLMPPEEAAAHRRQFAEQLEAKATLKQFEAIFVAEDGRELVFEATSTPLVDSSGVCTGVIGAVSDVSEKRHFEQALKQAERVARLGHWEWWPQLERAHWSDQTFRLFGLEPDSIEPSYEAAAQYIHPEDLEDFEKELQQALLDGERLDQEFRILQKDGTVLWIKNEGTIKRAENGAAEYLFGVVQDISLFKQAQGRELESRRRFELAVRAANVGPYDWNIKTNEVYYSPQYRAQLGYAESELEGGFEDWENSVHPDDREGAIAAVKAFLAGEISEYRNEFRVLHKDGKYRSVLSVGELFRDDAGEPEFMYGSHLDFTKEKDLEAKFRQVFDGSRDGIVMVDDRGRILEANKAYCEMLGYTLFELKEMEDFYKITPKKWRKWEEAEIWNKRLLAEGYSGLYEKEYVRKNGEVFPVELQSYAVRDDDGSVVYLWGVARDITERKQAELRLIESEEKYRQIVETEEIYVSIVSREGIVLFANDAAASLFCRSAEELLGESFVSFLPEGASFLSLIQEVVNSGESREYESWIEFPQSGRWLLSKMQPIIEPDSSYTVVQITSVDITERKLVEQALNDAHALLNSWMEHCPLVTFMKDMEGRMTFANRYFEELFSVPPGEMIGKTDFDLYPNSVETAKQMRANDRKVIAGGVPVTLSETVIVDDKPRHFETIKFPIYDQGGNPAGVAGFAADVSEKKAAEDALLESQQRYRSAVEDSPMLMCTFLSDTTRLFVNDAYCKYFNKTSEELVGKRFIEMLPEEDRLQLKNALASITPTNLVCSHEHHVLRSDGSPCWMKWSNRGILDDSGQVVLYQSFGEDITQRKLAEETLGEYQKRLKRLAVQVMQAEEAERKRIAAGLHDNVAQNLAFCKMRAGQLTRNWPKDIPREQVEQLREVLGEMIDEVRSLIFEISPPLLSELGLGPALGELAKKYENSFEFSCRVKQKLGERIKDQELENFLYHAGRELLQNVGKHAKANTVSLSVERLNGVIELVVEDDGRGFEAEPGQSQPSDELSFGLFFLRERASLLGGDIEITSQLGKGTRAKLWLPLSE